MEIKGAMPCDGMDIYHEYFLMACHLGIKSVVLYLFQKYDITKISYLSFGFIYCLRSNNIKFLNWFCQNIYIAKPAPYICNYKLETIEYLYNNIPFYKSNIIDNFDLIFWRLDLGFLEFSLKYFPTKINYQFLLERVTSEYFYPQFEWLVSNNIFDLNLLGSLLDKPGHFLIKKLVAQKINKKYELPPLELFEFYMDSFMGNKIPYNKFEKPSLDFILELIKSNKPPELMVNSLIFYITTQGARPNILKKFCDNFDIPISFTRVCLGSDLPISNILILYEKYGEAQIINFPDGLKSEKFNKNYIRYLLSTNQLDKINNHNIELACQVAELSQIKLVFQNFKIINLPVFLELFKLENNNFNILEWLLDTNHIQYDDFLLAIKCGSPMLKTELIQYIINITNKYNYWLYLLPEYLNIQDLFNICTQKSLRLSRIFYNKYPEKIILSSNIKIWLGIK